MPLDSPMMDEDQMPPMGQDEDAPAQTKEGNDESVSAFFPKAFMMGKKFKPGEIMEVKVVDVDPETGDVEVKYNTDGGDTKQEQYGPMPSEKGFDMAMPDEKGY